MASDVTVDGTARGIIESADDDRVILKIPGTDYRLHLQTTAAAAGDASWAAPGRRVHGVLNAQALRIHPAQGGGKFIEPVIGEPRIVAGRVLALDEPKRKVLLDVTVPIWVHTLPEQDFDVLERGGLVNCYVKSGTTFTPAE